MKIFIIKGDPIIFSLVYVYRLTMTWNIWLSYQASSRCYWYHWKDEKEFLHVNEIFVSGCAGSCHLDNFPCSQISLKSHLFSPLAAPEMVKCQLPVQPMTKISTKWRHLCSSVFAKILFADTDLELKTWSPINTCQIAKPSHWRWSDIDSKLPRRIDV